MKEEVALLYIDLFCGAGGTSTAAHQSEWVKDGVRYKVEVIVAINHDENAIWSHAVNNPTTQHFTEDIWLADLDRLKIIVRNARKKRPKAKLAIWMSAECTNHSNAKGGQSRDAGSRSLHTCIYRYIEALNPDIIQVENVVEFLKAGPVEWVESKQAFYPVKELQGTEYYEWVDKVKAYGFDYDYRVLCSADYGGRTIRSRYFGFFAKKGIAISFPQPTHGRRAEKGLKRWLPVKDCLDLEATGISIFKKACCEKTLKRILCGLERFVEDEESQFVFLSKAYSGHPSSKNSLISQPAGTITCVDHHQVIFIDREYGQSKPQSVNEPSSTVTVNPHFALVHCTKFIANQYSGGGQVSSIAAPNATVMTSPKQSVITAEKVPQNEENSRILGIDSDTMKKIKRFMQKHGITDIKKRMFMIPELLAIQGFPAEYVLKGTGREQKMYIGNSVEVKVGKAFISHTIRIVAEKNYFII